VPRLGFRGRRELSHKHVKPLFAGYLTVFVLAGMFALVINTAVTLRGTPFAYFNTDGDGEAQRLLRTYR
jgi:hypothetical protein